MNTDAEHAAANAHHNANAASDSNGIPQPASPSSAPEQTSELPGSAVIPPAAPETQLLPAKTEPPKDLPIGVAVIGAVEALSEIEEAKFMGYEAVVSMGWHTFVEVGLAFAQIRDERLHRVQFANFEAYCQAKWAYGRRYVNQLISAAQLVKHLGATSSLQKPDHETQVRPLVGLTPDQAQTAWERAVEKAGGRKITARLVKAAMQDLQLAPKASKPVSKIRPRTAQNAAGWWTTPWAKSSSC